MPRFLLIPALLVVLQVAACAPPLEEGAERLRRDLITAQEVEGAGITTNAHDIVRRLRPDWLRTRTTSPVRVYVNDGLIGNAPGALAGVSAQTITQLVRLTPTQATTRYGTGSGGHPEGAIVISTR